MLGLLRMVSAAGLAAALGGCNAGVARCDRLDCGPAPASQYAYAYVPRPAYFLAPSPDDPTLDYTRRSVTISTEAGNAQAANTALQTATPWPPHSRNTRIPGNGVLAARAVHELESGTREVNSAKRTLHPAGGGGPAIQINTGGASSPSP